PMLKVFYGVRLLAPYDALVHAGKVSAGGLTHNQRRHQRLDQQPRLHELRWAGLVGKQPAFIPRDRGLMSRMSGKGAASHRLRNPAQLTQGRQYPPNGPSGGIEAFAQLALARKLDTRRDPTGTNLCQQIARQGLRPGTAQPQLKNISCHDLDYNISLM